MITGRLQGRLICRIGHLIVICVAAVAALDSAMIKIALGILPAATRQISIGKIHHEVEIGLGLSLLLF